MTVKTATKIAVVGVGIGLFLGLAHSVMIDMTGGLLGWGVREYNLASRVTYYVRFLVTEGSLLLFLLVLSSKQKEQS